MQNRVIAIINISIKIRFHPLKNNGLSFFVKKLITL